jgi:hypothetical protein
MATAGLSLVGFMGNQEQAVNHLRHDCMPAQRNAPDATLIAEWHAARGRIGGPFGNAGNANPQPIPAPQQAYIQALTSEPWVTDRLQEQQVYQASIGCPPPSFQLVEIDPLLAFQFIVDTDRAEHNCRGLSNPPTLDELLQTFLPMAQPREDYFRTPVTPHSQSVIIKLRNHNLQLHRFGIFDAAYGQQVGGVLFHVSLPFVHVVRLNGRCYLHNGYHRVYAARMAGATHVPCIFRDVSHAEAVGIRVDGATFDEALLASANPPTIAHFTQGRAHPVSLRLKSRILHVTWQQYSVPDEYD